MREGKRQKAKGRRQKWVGQLALAGWLMCLLSGAGAQTIKVPVLYEQCQPLTESAAQTEAIAKHSAAFKSGEAKQRRAAAQALAKTCDPRVSNVLLEALKDEDAVVRLAVVEALGRLGNPETVEPLIEALQDRDWQVRAALGLALGSFNIHAARNATLNVLVNTNNVKVTDEGDLRARCFGVLVVNQMRDVRFSRKALSFLFDFLDYDDPKLRAIAEATARELQHTRNGYHELIGILKQHSYPDYRRKAAFWLGEWRKQEGRAALAEAAIADKDARVQQTAKAALEKLGN
jgi:HEAT repeat protein